ncbi:hypothetical protein A0H81_09472 [Grifola frondosa]|uniref:Uncharacterized protein n=1 Tax=Grifola frondosa TaxID=5627 RepID=A0A1C7M2T8_GRIFR|nr:hypothetical protein A0H81_09472 [Grifola frondosa]
MYNLRTLKLLRLPSLSLIVVLEVLEDAHVLDDPRTGLLCAQMANLEVPRTAPAVAYSMRGELHRRFSFQPVSDLDLSPIVNIVSSMHQIDAEVDNFISYFHNSAAVELIYPFLFAFHVSRVRRHFLPIDCQTRPSVFKSFWFLSICNHPNYIK